MAQDYYDGNVDQVIDEIWKETDKQLRKGVMAGYGTTGYDLNDWDGVIRLNSNIGVFSAFKSYRINQELKVNLTDENGKLSFDKFLKNYQKVDDQYNVNYLRAEYSLAQKQATAANQWNQFQKGKGLYPNLKYMPSRSAEPREDHTKYYGIIKPIDDPIWDELMPPIAWGCNCWVSQTDEPAESTTIETPEPIPGIVGNPGKKQLVFDNKHPYVKGVSKEDKKKIATFLSFMKEKHLSDQYVSGKVGKGRMKVSLNADPNGLSRNLDLSYTVVSNHGKAITVRTHSKVDDVKNPELDYNKVIGDGTYFDGTNTISYIKNSFAKYKTGKQLAKFEKSFIGLDFAGKINKSNYELAMRKLYGEFKEHDRCIFIFIKNKNKSIIVDGKDDYNSIIEKVKRELL